jgi:hypothetical protein
MTNAEFPNAEWLVGKKDGWRLGRSLSPTHFIRHSEIRHSSFLSTLTVALPSKGPLPLDPGEVGGRAGFIGARDDAAEQRDDEDNEQGLGRDAAMVANGGEIHGDLG